MSIMHATSTIAATLQVALDRVTAISKITGTPVGVPATASAGIEATAAGVINELRGEVTVPNVPTSLAPNYYRPGGTGLEIRLTRVSGHTVIGGSAEGVWLTLDSIDRSWYYTISGLNASRTGVWRLEIRRGTTVVATSADFPVTAQVEET